MLHQMLISPFISFHSSPPPSSQLEKERKMEFEPELAWDVVEKENNIFGEEFVDEFLDLGGLTETEKELDDDHKDNGTEKEEEEDSSAVSFEPPPPVSELAFPSHDVAELEWVSRLMDDSEFPSCSVAAVPPGENKPVVPVPPHEVEVKGVRAKRSKRNRSPSGSWSNWGPPDYSTSSPSSSTTTTIPTNSSSSACPSPSYSSSSPLIFFSALPKIPKKRGRKPKPRPPVEENQLYCRNSLVSLSSGVERRCSHCGVNKTPQWRAGPMGAKTLCNACGVRYKSGRLLPEYRPACSPTFLTHVHSNSHRKVLEMRMKKDQYVEENQNDQSLIQVPPVPSF